MAATTQAVGARGPATLRCMLVRAAVPDDAERLGEIHVCAWQSAYRGEFPDAYLDNLRAADRADLWRLHIPDGRVVVSEDERGHVVGFASYGPSFDPVGAGELFAMNVDPDHWRLGHGGALLTRVVAALTEAGHSEAVLLTGVRNVRAHSLYRGHEWMPDGSEKEVDVLGVTVREMRFRRSLQ